ncbi:MAG: tRNA (adenine(22)-N(1))-methyltransferase TrmK [Bacilli bacterium]|nr:tRNA (adenine(22)-N(1))-methyltransferase TrmK [Bacilli bacterium]
MKRIEELSNYIAPYSVIADIGCDHGYLIKIAFDKGLIKKAYAVDNKTCPLENAKKNLSEYRDIIYLLSSGLTDIGIDTEVVAIAGMGGNLIVKILEDGFDKLKNVNRIIIEANRNTEIVREFAVNNNLKIVSEKIIEEDSMFYEIIVLEKGKMELNPKEIKYGPLLLKNKDEMFIKKWTNQLNIYINKKTNKLDEEIKEIKDVLNYED